MKKPVGLVLVIVLMVLMTGCFHHAKKAAVAQPSNSAEPDKVLYEKALKDIAKGRYDIGRLSLQTLLNTYADSDYKEKAKLALADSYFKQAGTTGLVQAEAEYRDFIVFFPTSDDADDAQMRIAMTHYLQMEKPDRDFSQAKLAEQEFKNFLELYPNSPLKDEATQHLREVQEVLGTHDLLVARQNLMRRNYQGTVLRTKNILEKYPDFSLQDQALFLVGQSYEQKKEIPKAGFYYGVLVSYHPLSPLVDEARRRLENMNLPIPEVNPEALARARSDKENLEKHSFMGRLSGLFSKKPDISTTRKASRPPVPMIPKPVNEAAGGTAAPPVNAPPPNVGAAGDVSSGVAAEIISAPAAKTLKKEDKPSSNATVPDAEEKK
jgi:outer membrane protein assembly factor BamD